MNNDEYRGLPSANFSTLKHLLKSPAHFKSALDEEREETDAMRIGTLVHAMVLEGKNLTDMYAIKPSGMSFASKEGKAWRDAQTLPIIKEDDSNMVPMAAASVASNPFAVGLLKGCQHREMALHGNIMGVPIKARLDFCGSSDGEWAIGDLKTCQDASPREFARNVASFDLDLQCAIYTTLLASIHRLDVPPFWAWIAVEKKAPFTSVVYTAEDWMESGMAKLEKVLTLYKECKESGEWPQPYRGMHKLERPKWA